MYVLVRYSSTTPQAPATVFRNIIINLPFLFKPTRFSTARVVPIARKSHKINTNIPICRHGTCNLGRIFFLGIWYKQIHPASWHPISSPTGSTLVWDPQLPPAARSQATLPGFRPSKNHSFETPPTLGKHKGMCWKWHSNHVKPLCISKCIYIQIYGLRTSISIDMVNRMYKTSIHLNNLKWNWNKQSIFKSI